MVPKPPSASSKPEAKEETKAEAEVKEAAAGRSRSPPGSGRTSPAVMPGSGRSSPGTLHEPRPPSMPPDDVNDELTFVADV